jgi:hypothetical protein
MQNIRTSIFAAGILLSAALCISAQTNTSTLTVNRPVAAQFEDGPPLGALRLIPGEVLYFSFFADGFRKSADTRRVELTGHVQVLDPNGIAVAPTEEILIVTDLSEEDKDWKPKLRAAVSLPPIAPPGVYKVKYDVVDQQSEQTASGESTFGVEAKFVAPSGILSVRELNFYRNQDDTTALITASYRAGDIVWVKFYITGYKYGAEHSIDASYDVELLGPDGASIMKKEDAAMEKSMAFYPQPYIPCVFNLSLKPAMTHNVYTLVVTAHDNMGKQTATATSKFQVN